MSRLLSDHGRFQVRSQQLKSEGRGTGLRGLHAGWRDGGGGVTLNVLLPLHPVFCGEGGKVVLDELCVSPQAASVT